jgi:D-beta-D-heptose 7-phosphate kinase/D-beta-D-heptose 1-phosphate adenosyltransferase
MRVILNGCFDCLHAGHKHIIKYAIKVAGKYGEVIFLINTDSSIKKLKGPDRPIQSLSNRIEAIEEYWLTRTECYSWKDELPKAILKTFDTEEELEEGIKHFNPDMIIKGDDRPDIREIIGFGEYPICILPRLIETNSGEPFSTTKLIGKKCLKH